VGTFKDAPVYAAICRGVAEDTEVLAIVEAAPPAAHFPLVLLAAVHYLLLDGLEHPLADVYAGRSNADAALLFRDLCLGHRDELGALMAYRHIQTNEVGRSALFGPALAVIADRIGAPLALVDVGASAGLNLRLDRYLLDYGTLGTTGPADATVRVPCRVVGGNPPIRTELPPLTATVGIDREPVDISDAEDARWLVACVWPETDRVPRMQLAIEEGRKDPREVIAGDALEVLPGVVDDLPDGTAACVLTSWSFAYFPVEAREAFAQLLVHLSRQRPIAWLYGEQPGVGPAFGEPPDECVLGVVHYDDGVPDPVLLASVQPHGEWLDWKPNAIRR
jgi:hypothetical protein